MSERVWDRFLTDQDHAHLERRDKKGRIGFGARPAVLSVDNYRQAVGDEPQPLLDAIESWPSSTGLAGWNALEHIETLFSVARAASLPIIHVTGLLPQESGVSGWRHTTRGEVERTDADAERELRRYDIVPQAAPVHGEVVLRKAAPSAFFGTPLMAHLTSQHIDTLIVCGESTSGCVRATVVDGRSYRLRMIVVEECVYDRHEAPHAINLFDMNQKYADVLGLDEVTSWIEQRVSGR
ncbi:MAG: isochorismatase family protein [Actinobacteria bacterium]|jgi:nicotinamidase-related amidase|nr:isochorismatase family protein [Actinomycetota bacterium]